MAAEITHTSAFSPMKFLGASPRCGSSLRGRDQRRGEFARAVAGCTARDSDNHPVTRTREQASPTSSMNVEQVKAELSAIPDEIQSSIVGPLMTAIRTAIESYVASL